MDRNNFSIRKHTSLSQKLPRDLEVRLTVFYRHLKELRLEHELDEDVLLAIMGEVPMTFDTVSSQTVHPRGDKDVREKKKKKKKKTEVRKTLYYSSCRKCGRRVLADDDNF